MTTWADTRQSLAKDVRNTPAKTKAPATGGAAAAAGNSAATSAGAGAGAAAGAGSAAASAAGAAGGQSSAKAASEVLNQVKGACEKVTGLMSLGQDMMNAGFAELTSGIAAAFPAFPAATLSMPYVGLPHAHSHPPSLIPPAPPVPLPSLGPILIGTSVRVLINGMPAARAGDIGIAPTCCGFAPFFMIQTGSSKVFIGGNRAARQLDFCKVCAPAKRDKSGPIKAGAAAAAAGKAARAVSTGMSVAGKAATAAGVAADLADIAEAEAEDDGAMAAAKAIGLAMQAAQAAADAAAQAMAAAMGKDPAIPPVAPAVPGTIVAGHPNVLIGGFPMVNFPNPAEMLLNRVKRYVGKPKPPKAPKGRKGCAPCAAKGGG